jgi:hypothetical protein
MIRKPLLLLLLPLLVAGCTTVTNLTARKQPRNAEGLYLVEAAWATRQATIKPETIKPYVVVGHETYPMKLTPLASNRWEALVPVPNEKESIVYRFKFDFERKTVPEPLPDSVMSDAFRLDIVER